MNGNPTGCDSAGAAAPSPAAGARPGLHAMLVWTLERERERIAAGIHDDTLQVVTAVTLRLQQLRRRLRRPDDLAVLDKLEETVGLAVDRLRKLIFEFRPPSLERQGLVAALREYLAQMTDGIDLTVRLNDRTASEPPQQTRLLIYRIAQEALANVIKHARASRVDIQLTEVDQGYRVTITDNGVGFEPRLATPGPGHLGLILMQERAEIAGGWYRVDSTPGGGTTVEFWVPRDDDGRRVATAG